MIHSEQKTVKRTEFCVKIILKSIIDPSLGGTKGKKATQK
jgi:hypothetical protein